MCTHLNRQTILAFSKKGIYIKTGGIDMGSPKTEQSFNMDSVNLLVSTAKSEYESEHNRTSIIDSKAGISLPIVSAYFLALAPMNNYKDIFLMKINCFWNLLIPAFLFITYTVSLILSFISVLMMVRVITTREYMTITPSDLYDENYLQNDQVFLSIKILSLYIETTENNKLKNDKRIPLYRNSWLLTIISIISFVIYIIIINNI